MSAQTLSRPRPASSASRWYRRAAGALAFAVLIELASRTGLADPEFLPPASEIVWRAGALLLDPGFGAHALTSLLAWAIGLCVAALLAVPLGLLLGSVPIIDAAMRSVVEFLRPIPSVALIPLVALVIGTGLQHRIALVVYASLWPILYNTMYGLRGVDPWPRSRCAPTASAPCRCCCASRCRRRRPSSPPASGWPPAWRSS
ncbi:ABC transporter permease [Nonomuraea rubra]|uniref:ABC transporter permease n=1 Tax=Nonomuraea rubra TaxID=46180 RepID=UPI00360CA269